MSQGVILYLDLKPYLNDWVGTNGGGLEEYNPALNKFTHHLSAGKGTISDNTVRCVYEDKNGIVSNLKKSNSGYGIFEYTGGINQNDICKQNGYYQYDFPKYLTFGRINPDLVFSEKYNKILIESLLESNKIEKIFIEPHLKARLHLTDSRIRFQGCRSVRHDDHIHVQIK